MLKEYIQYIEKTLLDIKDILLNQYQDSIDIGDDTIQAVRVDQTRMSTLTQFFHNNEPILYNQEAIYCLEPPVTVYKELGNSAIGEGVYPVVKATRQSNNEVALLLSSVRYFTGIFGHTGNFIWDTDGCFLPGINPRKVKYPWIVKRGSIEREIYLESYEVYTSRLTKEFLIDYVLSHNIKFIQFKNNIKKEKIYP